MRPAAGLLLPQPLAPCAPPSNGWVVIRLGTYRAESSAEVDEPSRFISRFRPFCRKVRKKLRLWRTLRPVGAHPARRRNTKLTLLRHSQPRMVQSAVRTGAVSPG